MKKLIALLALALALGALSARPVAADQSPTSCVDSSGVSHPGSIPCGNGHCCKP